MTPSACPRRSPLAAVKASASRGANLNPAADSCSRIRASWWCPRARPGGKHRTAPPIILHPTQAFGPDDARAEVGARQFGRRLRGALERNVDRGIDRLERQTGAIEIEHLKAPLKGRSRC